MRGASNPPSRRSSASASGNGATLRFDATPLTRAGIPLPDGWGRRIPTRARSDAPRTRHHRHRGRPTPPQGHGRPHVPRREHSPGRTFTAHRCDRQARTRLRGTPTEGHEGHPREGDHPGPDRGRAQHPQRGICGKRCPKGCHPSGRVAIAEAVEKQAGNHSGQRNEKATLRAAKEIGARPGVVAWLRENARQAGSRLVGWVVREGLVGLSAMRLVRREGS